MTRRGRRTAGAPPGDSAGRASTRCPDIGTVHRPPSRRRLARLQHRIFLWFGAAILLSGLTAAGVVWLIAPHHTPADHLASARTFVTHRLAAAWDRPDERASLTRDLADDLGLDLSLVDAQGVALERAGAGCDAPDLTIAIARDDRPLGELRVCIGEEHVGPSRALLGLLGAGLLLWLLSGAIARRLTRRLERMAGVARGIGRGALARRLELDCQAPGELGDLAGALHDMSARIEQQLADQRELLAAVSHEIRTPLGHMRVLLEMLRDDPAGVARLADELEREVLAIDALVDPLLASARLDFEAVERRPVDAAALAARALERAGLDPGLLAVEVADASVEGDASLMLQAIANLVANAGEHGGGLVRLRIGEDGDHLVITTEDRGPGLPAETDVFAPFARGRPGRGSLGLGLSLVRRIAEAHGGLAFAGDREGGGARVGFSVARRGPEVETG